MKNKIITVCIILAAVLSFMSFAAVLTQMNTKGNEPDEVITEAPDSSKSGLSFFFNMAGQNLDLVYSFEEGITWKEFFESDAYVGEMEHFSVSSDSEVCYHDCYLCYFNDEGNQMSVTVDDIIEPRYYFF